MEVRGTTFADLELFQRDKRNSLGVFGKVYFFKYVKISVINAIVQYFIWKKEFKKYFILFIKQLDRKTLHKNKTPDIKDIGGIYYTKLLRNTKFIKSESYHH